MRTALLRAALPLLVVLAAAGCRAKGPAAPVHAADDAAFAAPANEPLAGLDPDEGPALADRIRPGDVLALRVLGAKGLDQAALIVDRSGRVHLALSGDVSVGETTLPEAEARLTAAMRAHDRFAQAVVTVVEAKGRFATVVGAVEKPGNVPLVGEGRVVEVLASAGGAKSTTVEDRLVALGDLDAARIVRDGKALPIDLRRALQGDRRHDIRLLPGDLIFVPPLLAGRVSVLGHVGKPRTMAFRPGLRLTEALADAGGPTQPADLEDVRVLRGGLSHPRMYVANLRDVLAARRPDVELAPGDVVFVTEHWFATTTDVLARLVPAVATTVLAGTLAK